MNSKRSGLLNGFAVLVRNGNALRAANVETTIVRVRNAKNARPGYSDHRNHNQTASPGLESARQLRTRTRAITRPVKQRLHATTSKHVGIARRRSRERTARLRTRTARQRKN